MTREEAIRFCEYVGERGPKPTIDSPFIRDVEACIDSMLLHSQERMDLEDRLQRVKRQIAEMPISGVS